MLISEIMQAIDSMPDSDFILLCIVLGVGLLLLIHYLSPESLDGEHYDL